MLTVYTPAYNEDIRLAIAFLIAILSNRLLLIVNHMATITLHIKDADGKIHKLTVDKDAYENIVDIAEERGVELPYACRSGACYSCCATVTK